MRRAGFTLIELLVVISSVALLMALLLPALHRAREAAKATRCGANLRQLGAAMYAYDTDYRSLPYGFGRPGMRPPPGGFPGNASADAMGWWWFNFMGVAYYESDVEMRRLLCPSKRLDDTGLQQDLLCGNYGANRALCKTLVRVGSEPADEFEGRSLSVTSLHHPGATMLVMDSGYALICWWHATREPPVQFGPAIQDTAYVPGLEINRDKILWPGQHGDAINGRHPNRTVNVACADGHVERRKAGDLLVEKTGDDDWDYRPLWAPE